MAITDPAGMTDPFTHGQPDPRSEAVKGACAVGFGLALTFLLLSWIGGEYLSWWRSIPRAVAVVVLLATPPTLAVLADRRRPSMLLVAGATGLMPFTVPRLFYLLPYVILGVIWLAAFGKVSAGTSGRNVAAAILTPLLWIGASLALWVHIDPVCEMRMADGRVIAVDAGERGFESGWFWQVDDSTSTGSGILGPDVQAFMCASDTVTILESLVVVALCSIGLLTAMALTVRTDHVVNQL